MDCVQHKHTSINVRIVDVVHVELCVVCAINIERDIHRCMNPDRRCCTRCVFAALGALVCGQKTPAKHPSSPWNPPECKSASRV